MGDFDMSLDKNPISISQALIWAKQYYPQDKYDHAIRVMQYVYENPLIPKKYKNDCLVLAIMHDLVEDTTFTGDNLPEQIHKALYLLTKPKNLEYPEYIKQLRQESGLSEAGICAWWVKLADMKDHLAQTETLTDRLKEKYLAALPYLL